MRLLRRMTMVVGLACTVWCAAAASASAQEADHTNLESGLPTELEDAYPTPFRDREFQFYSRYEYAEDGSGRFELRPRAELGVLPNTQLSVSVPAYVGPGDRTGSGDVEASLLYNFNTEGVRVPAFAVGARAVAPTGVGSAGLDVAARGVLTKSLGSRFDRVHLNAEIFHNAARAPFERSTRYTAIAGYSGSIGTGMLLVADVVRRQGPRAGSNENIVEVGIRRQFKSLWVMTAGAGAGLGEQSPKFRIALGLQWSLTH